MARHIDDKERILAQKIGARVRYYRLRAGYLSSSKFAEMIGVTGSTYRNYERGEHLFPLMQLKRAAEILNLTLDDLTETNAIYPVHNYKDARDYLASIYATYTNKASSEDATDEEIQQAAWRFCMHAEAFAWIFGLTPEYLTDQAHGRAKMRKLV